MAIGVNSSRMPTKTTSKPGIKHTLKASPRKITGRKVKQLRSGGLLPSNIYGKKVKSTSISVNLKDFEKVYSEAGETGLVELSLGTTKRPVLIHNVQKEPVTDLPIHVDFYQVNLKEKVQTTVPLEIKGEAPAEASGAGTVVQQIQEVEVEALPTDLPDEFIVDVSKLEEVDQAILVKDLKVGKGVKVITEPDQIIVKVEPPQKEEVVEPEPAPVEEVVEGETQEGKTEAPEGEQKEQTEEKPQEEAKEQGQG